MMRILLHYGLLSALVTALVLVGPRFLPRIRVKTSKVNAVVVGLSFAAANLLLGKLIALVIGLLSLGLFLVFGFVATFLSNAVLLYAIDNLLKEFEVEDFTSLAYLAGVITLANGVLGFALR